MRGNVTEGETFEYDAWSSYSETVLIFAGEKEIVVDLSEPVLHSMTEVFKANGLESSFAVLTSCNPFGKDITDAENARRFSQLETELDSLALEYVVLDACSPDRSHCERSVAVCMERTTAIEIARGWDQLAIFWFDLQGFWIYGAIKEAAPVSLPR